FVWAGSVAGVEPPLSSWVSDQFLVRAMGAFDIYSSTFVFSNGVSTYVYVDSTGLAMATGSSVTLSGANGIIVTQSSITASAFFGDGSHLTGLSGSAVQRTGDAMTGPLTMLAASTIT